MASHSSYFSSSKPAEKPPPPQESDALVADNKEGPSLPVHPIVTDLPSARDAIQYAAPDKYTAGQKHSTSEWMVFLTAFCNYLNYSSVLPMLSLYITALHGSDTTYPDPGFFRRGHLHWNLAVCMSAWGLGACTAGPLLGFLSDRFGRKWVLVSTTCLAGCANVLYMFAPSLGWLVLARLLSGICESNSGVQLAYLTEVSPPDILTQKVVVLKMMEALGFVLGPLLNSITAFTLRQYSESSINQFSGPALLISLSFFGLAASFAQRFQEPPKGEQEPEQQAGKQAPSDADQKASRSPLLIVSGAVHVLLTCAFVVLEFLSAPYMQKVHEFSLTAISTVWLVVAMLVLLNFLIMTGTLVHHFDDVFLMVMGELLFLVYWLGNSLYFIVSPILFWDVCTLALFIVGFPWCFTMSITIFCKLTPSATLGKVQGMLVSAIALGRVLVPILTGSITAVLDIRYAFLVGAALVSGALVPSLAYYDKLPRHAPR